MAKVKLLSFELVSLKSEGKRIVDHIQRLGVAEITKIDDDLLDDFDTDAVIDEYSKKNSLASNAISVIEKHCSIKRSLVQSLTDYKEIEYSEYRLLTDKADSIEAACKEALELNKEIEALKQKITEERNTVEYYTPWKSLDIPMGSKRTTNTTIFIGTLDGEYDAERISQMLVNKNENLSSAAVETVSVSKLQTCIVVVAHNSLASETEASLREIGFTLPDKIYQGLPSKAIESAEEKIKTYEQDIRELEGRLSEYSDMYESFRFFYDYTLSQIEKYKAVNKSAQTDKTFIIRGYIPELMSEEIKFDIENKFLCQIEFSEPDFDNEDVPVLIENGWFAGGVESITNMYSSPSNKDVDPNPIMAVFYYIFFGFMLSDAGYGVLMLLFSIIAKKKFKVTGSKLKFVNMVFYCGISTVFWGTMFGGWFGDLIPTVFTEFLGYSEGPDLSVWMDPVSNSMTLLLFCLGFGIIQLFTGLLIHGYMLIKNKQYFGAICDTVPVMIFVVGFAILGASLITEIPDRIMPWSTILLAVGAVLIILTAGRDSKNIIGKLGGGLYALYNTTTGYLGDILSYSRLLALGLVTGVIANAVNLLASMPGNIILFVLIFIVGHTINFSINVIGTYVHTNRLQYVEFFSKFYEGSGRCFTPFKLNSKYFIVKEEKKYD